jgi:hypothetical protein
MPLLQPNHLLCRSPIQDTGSYVEGVVTFLKGNEQRVTDGRLSLGLRALNLPTSDSGDRVRLSIVAATVWQHG